MGCGDKDKRHIVGLDALSNIFYWRLIVGVDALLIKVGEKSQKRPIS